MTNSMIFVNLPVRDLERAKSFFASLGYTFNPKFTDEKATCMVISEHIFAMLLIEPFFASFIDRPISDARAVTEVLVALTCESRAQVDEVCNAAFAAGARRYGEPRDHGFMYQWGFEDLDGHKWEYFWMDPSAQQ